MDKDFYNIWSYEHKAWWRPNQSGYTKDLAQAGSYSKEEAADIVIGHIPSGEEVAVSEIEARFWKPLV